MPCENVKERLRGTIGGGWCPGVNVHGSHLGERDIDKGHSNKSPDVGPEETGKTAIGEALIGCAATRVSND